MGEGHIFVQSVKKNDTIEKKEEFMEDDKDLELLKSEEEDNRDETQEEGDCGD